MYTFVGDCVDIQDNRQATYVKQRWDENGTKQSMCTAQSSVIFMSSNGIGTKLSSTIPRERSSGSVCGGTSCRIRSGRTESSSRVKSNSRGKSLPFGILAPSTRNSSKNGWIIASTELNRAPGVYSSSFATRSIASEEVRGRKTFENG